MSFPRRAALRPRPTSLLALPVLLATLAVAACGGDSPSEPPTPQSVAGIYQAKAGQRGAMLEVTRTSGTTDYLAQGASIRLVMIEDGTTEGRIFVPSGAENGGDFDADLAGTWTLQGDTVRLAHPVDTFLKDLSFAVKGDRLVAERLYGTDRVKLVLSK